MGALNGVVNVHRVVYGRPEMGDCIILRGTTLMSPLWTDHHDRYSDDWAHGPFGLMSSFLFLPMMRTAQRLNSRNHCGILGLTFGMDAWNGHVGRATLGYSRGLIFNTTKFVSTCQSRLPGFTAIPFTCIQRYILGTSMNSPNTKCTTMVRSRLHVKAQHKTGFKKQGLHASRCTRGEKQSTLLGM